MRNLKYTRLIFSVSHVGELFPREIENDSSGFPGTKNISNDTITLGRNIAELLARIEKGLARQRPPNLTINHNEFEFMKSEIFYMGHKLFAVGFLACHTKITSMTLHCFN